MSAISSPVVSGPPQGPSSASASSTQATSSASAVATSSTTDTSVHSTSSSASPSSSVSSSAASISSSSPSSSNSPLSPSSSQQVLSTTDAGGGVQVFTTYVTPTSTATTSPQIVSTSSNSFFSNKGAVAGVFAVVGVIVVALIIAFVVNAIRRQRAQKFDRDVAEAAAEAAAARSPFDEFSYGNPKGSGGYGYSDNSHGTFQMPPLQPQNERYGMTEMAQFDPYAAGAASLAAVAAAGRSRNRKDSEPGTPGLAGVGAGTLAREPSRRAPYHAFAGPGPQAPEMPGSSGVIPSIRGTNQDVLEAVGLAGPPGVGAIPGNGFNSSSNHHGGSTFVSRRPSDTTQNTHFSGRSQFGSLSSGGQHQLPPLPLQPGYPVDSYYPHRNDNHSPDPFATYPPVAQVSKPLPNPHESTIASPPLGGGSPSDHHEDLVEMGSQTALRSEEQRMSYQDDEDYGQGSRILRVANE